MTVLAAHQPQYLPWLGFFDKLDQADVFVLLDDVQFKKNEWQNRNRIKTAQGWQWLTVPVRHRFPQLILEVEIDHWAPWARKHAMALTTNYSAAPHAEELLPPLLEVLGRDWSRLAPLNLCLIDEVCKCLGISTRRVQSSQVPTRDDASRRLVDLCRHFGADTYLSGEGAREYLELRPFREAGVAVRFQEYRHPVYPQLYGDFEPNLSIVDLLLNCGAESLEILRSGRVGAG